MDATEQIAKRKLSDEVFDRLKHMIVQGVQGVQFVCANTDAQALNRSAAHELIQLGTMGEGLGGEHKVKCGRG